MDKTYVPDTDSSYEILVGWLFDMYTKHTFPSDNNFGFYYDGGHPNNYLSKSAIVYLTYERHLWYDSHPDIQKYLDHDSYLMIETDSHGYSGGSCWGDDPSYYTRDVPADFNFNSLFYHLAKMHFPYVTFLVMADIIKEAVTVGIREEAGYYGNSSSHVYHLIDLRKLADLLEHNGLI